MGNSSAEIDQEIRHTRGELDRQLSVLERRAASGARRYGLMAAGIALGALAVAAGIILYRRRGRASAPRLQRMVRSAQRLPGKARRRLPIKVVVTDRANDEHAPGTLASIAQKVAPAVAGSATGAVVARVGRRPASHDSASG
jgi:hypothetical protein